MGLSNEALRLAELGYRVFPCEVGGKKPLTQHGCKDATIDEEQIEEWWTQWPEANIGVSTDGLLVVDVDPVDGGPNPWLASTEEQAELMDGAATITPRQGTHFWFRQPEGRSYGNTAGKIAPRVDTRANGGYVIVPPSRVAGVGLYQWSPFFELKFGPSDLPEPPEWLLELLSERPREAPRSAPGGAENQIPDGQRNSTLASLAGVMRRAGMGEAEIRAALRATNVQRCNPPLEVDEVDKIAWSIARHEPDQITQATVEGWWQQDHKPTPPPRKPDPGNLPEDLLRVPGLIGELIDWNLSTAYKPQPELALAAAIALMATITGRKVEDDFGTRTNLYALGVCESGGGKEHARKCNKELLRLAGLESLIGPEGIGSHAGLVSTMNVKPPVRLLQIDEIGRVLKTVQNPERSPHLYHIVTVFMKLFTSSNSLYVGDAYADVKKVVELPQPHCVMYATTVPKSFLESLTRESLSDGFVSRLLVFEASNSDPDPRKAPKQAPPEGLIEAVAWWGAYNPGGNLSAEVPQPRTIGTEACEAIFADLETAVRAKRKLEEDASLWTRAIEKARKLALIYTLSADREAPEVTSEAAEWACRLVTHLTERLEHLAEKWVSDGVFDGQQNLILRHLTRAGERGLTKSELCVKTRSMRPRERMEVIQALLDSGQIVAEQGPSKTRHSVVYRLA